MLWGFGWWSLWTQLLLGSISHPSLPLDIHVWDQHTCTFFYCWLGQGSLQQALSVLSPHISSLRWNKWWHLVVLQWPQWLVETLRDSYLHPIQFPNPHNAEFSRFSQYSATWHCHTLYLHLLVVDIPTQISLTLLTFIALRIWQNDQFIADGFSLVWVPM